MFIFDYHDNVFCAESVPLTKIALEVGTPFYCYSTERLKQNYCAYSEPLAGMRATVHYAVKANANQAVLHTLANCGAGADVMSAGEMERALHAGIHPDKITLSGVGKTYDEIASAIVARIYQMNAESLSELHLISQVALSLERTVPVVLRINPDIDPLRHRKPSLNPSKTKFGIDAAQLAEAIMLASTLPGLKFKGLGVNVDVHGYDYEPFRQAYVVLADMVRICRGQGIEVQRVNLGGGIGIPYDGQKFAPYADYVAMVRDTIGPLGCAISLEPGQRLVGDAGILVARVVAVKKTPTKNYLVIDAGTNNLALSGCPGVRHGVLPVDEYKDVAVLPIAVVGPISETGDLFGDNYFLPPMAPGDLVALLQAGAYGSSMESPLGGRPLTPEVLVAGSEYAVVRRRIPVSEQVSWEMLPSWLTKSYAA